MTESAVSSTNNAATQTSDALLLSLESSCDETAAAIIARDGTVLSSIVATQTELHSEFGGVVPEIASRAHVERLLPVMEKAMADANARPEQLAAVAVTSEPGLVGSLLVGLTAAKTLAWSLNIPLVTVNHIEAHLYACQMIADEPAYPCVGLVVSGGHTHIYDCRSPTDVELIGWTIDDAAGEAFDKAARVLELPYPGGPVIDQRANCGDAQAFKFPRPMIHRKELRFSFSGLKTAILYEAKGKPGGKKVEAPPMTDKRIDDLCASFQEAVVDCLIAKCRLALKQTGYRTLCVGGGVACNSRFRAALEKMRRNHNVLIAPPEYCTDNAAMGAIGWELLDRGMVAELDVDVTPGLIRVKER